MGDFKKLEYEWINEQGEAKHTDNPNLVEAYVPTRISSDPLYQAAKAGLGVQSNKEYISAVFDSMKNACAEYAEKHTGPNFNVETSKYI